MIDRGLTDEIPPRKLSEVILYAALLLLHRFKFISAMNLAAYCFPERAKAAAHSAANRALRKACRDGYARKYLSSDRVTFYALTAKGAYQLAEYGLIAKSSTRHRKDSQRMRHRLSIQQFVLIMEMYECDGYAEHERFYRNKDFPLIGRVKKYDKFFEYKNATHELVSEEVREKKHCKSTNDYFLSTHMSGHKNRIRPDALIFLPNDEIVWVEIDCSTRGSRRLSDLNKLLEKFGSKFRDGNFFVRHAVIHTALKTQRSRVLNILNKILKKRPSAFVGELSLASFKETGSQFRDVVKFPILLGETYVVQQVKRIYSEDESTSYNGEVPIGLLTVINIKEENLLESLELPLHTICRSSPLPLSLASPLPALMNDMSRRKEM